MEKTKIKIGYATKNGAKVITVSSIMWDQFKKIFELGVKQNDLEYNRKTSVEWIVINRVKFEDNCPECGEKYVTSCRCPRSDRHCKNGHHWSRCLAHEKPIFILLRDNTDTHKKETMACICDLRKEV